MQNKKAVILHQEVSLSASADELDVLAQVEVVERALQDLGYETHRVGFSLQLERVRAELGQLNPSFVFNLVESVAGDGGLIALAPSLLDHLGLNYTGCSAAAIFQTSHKVIAKRILKLAGLPTPETIFQPGQAFIVKAIWEHASIGLDARSVVNPQSQENLAQRVAAKSRELGRPFFAERYVHGREFCVPLLNGKVLPISEMKFLHADPAQIRVLGYQAKWDPDSADYQNSVPSYEVNPRDLDLYRQLIDLAEKAWALFALRGYARVDFRVDEAGNPWILEINANPCIAPGSGFFTAASRVYPDFRDVIKNLVPAGVDA